MSVNTSSISATIGHARFEASGPVEVVLAQYTHFLKTHQPALPDSGPLTPGAFLWRRCVSVGVPTAAAHPLVPGRRLFIRCVAGPH